VRVRGEWRECVRELSHAPSIRLALLESGAPLFKDGPAPQLLGFTRGALGEHSQLLQPANADAVSVAHEVPAVLASFFPGGKILPFNVPEFLKCAVRPVVRDAAVVDIDIDLEALHSALHRRSIQLFEENKVAEARDLLVRLAAWKTDAVTWYNLACAHSILGSDEDALISLKAAIDCGYTNLQHMLEDSDLGNVRRNAQFSLLVQEMLAKTVSK